MRDRDDTRLFRNNDGDGVTPLGHPQAGPVAGTQVAVAGVGSAERKDAAGGYDAPLTDDDRTVVQGGVGKEDAEEQVAGHLGIEIHAGFDYVLQAGVAHQHDERAMTGQGKLASSLGDRLDNLA